MVKMPWWEEPKQKHNDIPIITADDVELFYANHAECDDFRCQEVPVRMIISILGFIAIHKAVRLSAAGKQHEGFQYEKLAYVYGDVADKL